MCRWQTIMESNLGWKTYRQQELSAHRSCGRRGGGSLGETRPCWSPRDACMAVLESIPSLSVSSTPSFVLRNHPSSMGKAITDEVLFRGPAQCFLMGARTDLRMCWNADANSPRSGWSLRCCIADKPVCSCGSCLFLAQALQLPRPPCELLASLPKAPLHFSQLSLVPEGCKPETLNDAVSEPQFPEL